MRLSRKEQHPTASERSQANVEAARNGLLRSMARAAGLPPPHVLPPSEINKPIEERAIPEHLTGTHQEIQDLPEIPERHPE